MEERLPEFDGEYYPLVLVTLYTGATTVAFYRDDDKVWYVYESGAAEMVEQFDDVVIAWKPFPMPYIQPPKSKCIPGSWVERTTSEFERVE